MHCNIHFHTHCYCLRVMYFPCYWHRRRRRQTLPSNYVATKITTNQHYLCVSLATNSRFHYLRLFRCEHVMCPYDSWDPHSKALQQYWTLCNHSDITKLTKQVLILLMSSETNPKLQYASNDTLVPINDCHSSLLGDARDLKSPSEQSAELQVMICETHIDVFGCRSAYKLLAL